MATTVGTESTLGDLLDDLIELDYDAADAYQAAIDRLDDPAFRSTLAQLKGDHLRHIDELGTVLMGMGRTPPKQGSFKSILARGKVVIGGLAGDKAILEAMRTNEADTNTAYERAVRFRDLPLDARDALDRGLEDERRHCEWILETLKTL
jgi:uncharacterized protein (TIGR02284 family)